MFSGVGGWAGIGLAAGLTNPTDGLGAVGGYAGLKEYTNLGGSLTVFALPYKRIEKKFLATIALPPNELRVCETLGPASKFDAGPFYMKDI